MIGFPTISLPWYHVCKELSIRTDWQIGLIFWLFKQLDVTLCSILIARFKCNSMFYSNNLFSSTSRQRKFFFPLLMPIHFRLFYSLMTSHSLSLPVTSWDLVVLSPSEMIFLKKVGYSLFYPTSLEYILWVLDSPVSTFRIFYYLVLFVGIL